MGDITIRLRNVTDLRVKGLNRSGIFQAFDERERASGDPQVRRALSHALAPPLHINGRVAVDSKVRGNSRETAFPSGNFGLIQRGEIQPTLPKAKTGIDGLEAPLLGKPLQPELLVAEIARRQAKTLSGYLKDELDVEVG